MEAVELVGRIDMLDDFDENPIDIGAYFIQRTNPFEHYNDYDFVLRYRFTKPTVRLLIDMLTEELVRPTKRHNSLAVDTQVRKRKIHIKVIKKITN